MKHRTPLDLRHKKILIIKLRYIGDTLSIVPVIDRIKEYVPEAIVDVLIRKGTEQVVAFHPGIRNVWVYDQKRVKSDFRSSAPYQLDLIRRLRKERFDYILDYTHGDRAAILSFLIRAPIRISYRCSSPLTKALMNRFVDSNPFEHHIVEYQLKALSLFNLPVNNPKMNIHIPEIAEKAVNEILVRNDIEPQLDMIAIHPGARGRLRQWRPERFALIGDRLMKHYQAQIILVGGSDELDVIEKVEKCMRFKPVLSTTGLNLLEMAALFRKCRLFLGNDSAPGHIAAAVDCPTVSLFGPTFPHMWSPYNRRGDVLFKNPPCCGCLQKVCDRPEENCMDLIETDEVWNCVQKVLSLAEHEDR
jgi:predicted lipopolysaccharide heptosyltransferase III